MAMIEATICKIILFCCLSKNLALMFFDFLLKVKVSKGLYCRMKAAQTQNGTVRGNMKSDDAGWSRTAA